MMKKMFLMGVVVAAMTSANVDAMGYGMPSYGMPSGYGMPSQSGYGMPQQSYGMPQQSYGMPSQSSTTVSGGTNALTQDVKNEILKNVMNNPAISADLKGEAAFSVALKVSLNESVICLTFSPNGQIFRLHTNSKNNGIVTDQAEIQNFNNLMNQAKSNGGTATIQSSIVSNGQPESFVFEALAIDNNHLVVVRHK